MNNFKTFIIAVWLSVLSATALFAANKPETKPITSYKTTKVDGLDIFYREAGPKDAPAIVLLHGFPTSSQMYRNLIPALADRYHVIAPDYPGFGQSSMPSMKDFDYSFASITDIVDDLLQQLGIQRYSLYVQDYGGPVGFRLAVKHPERVQALIVQNGNAYDEGLREFWDPIKAYWKDRTEANGNVIRATLFTAAATKWQYTNGVRSMEDLDPSTWTADQYLLDRPGNQDIQLKLFYEYGTNPPVYPKWQAYFREHQPPTLIVWGKNDKIFPAEGAYPYKRDLKNIEFHLLDTGHFALEEDGPAIAAYMRSFLGKNVHGNGAASVTVKSSKGKLASQQEAGR